MRKNCMREEEVQAERRTGEDEGVYKGRTIKKYKGERYEDVCRYNRVKEVG